MRERIRNAIAELNYKPNIFAQGLKSRKSKTLGVILPDIVNPFFSTIFKSVEEIAHRNGYNVILCITDENAEKETDYLHILKTRSIDGYLLVPSPSIDFSRYKIIEGEHIVFAVRKPALDNIICYKNTDFHVLRIPVEYLIQLGHRRIAIINLPLTIEPARERLEGYKKTLLNNNIKVDEKLIRYSPFSIAASYEQTTELLNMPDRPTAIIPTNVALALGAIRAIYDARLKIPDDVSIISLDDFGAAALLNPPLTTVLLPVRDIGAQAVTALLKLIKGTPFKEEIVELGPELIIRESCRAI